MTDRQINHLKCMILVSAPWPIFNRPSIQLGTLKAYLHKQFPDIEIINDHFYLKIAESIGYTDYQTISKRTWLAETVYGALLYPKRKDAIERVFYGEAAKNPAGRKLDFNTLLKKIRKVSIALIEERDWGRFGLAGFSISLCQLTASLYIIRQIKRRYPDLPIVVGGSMVSGVTGPGLIKSYPQIDYLVNGEGEIPLEQLILHIRNATDSVAFPRVRGLIARKPEKQSVTHKKTTGDTGFSQLKRLHALPPPDYDDYFYLLRTFAAENRFFPTLSVEASRGCWWHQHRGKKKFPGCAFCNLNLQWEGYRMKRVDQTVREIDAMTTRYQILSVAFMDNLLPLKVADLLFDRIKGLGKDFKLFGEIRADFPGDTLHRMKAAGVSEVQIGIEAMSTRLLQKMNKGTTAIQNLSAMRNCEALGISHRSNLILNFPGSDLADVEETLKTLAYAAFYRPLQPVSFWLGLGSPVWNTPGTFRIRSVFNHPNYTAIFPLKIVSSVRFPIQAYRGDRSVQRKLWRPVKERMKIWGKEYNALRGASPILSFRDGGTFLIIRQKRLSGSPATHRLVGTSRRIYLYCQKPRNMKDIVERFPHLGEEKIGSFLNMMVGKRLMFGENGNCLSLAVPANPIPDKPELTIEY